MKKLLLLSLFISVGLSQSDGFTVISNNGGGEQNIFTALITNDYDIHNIWYHPSPVHSIAYVQQDSTLIAPLIIDNAIMPLSVMASGGRFQKLNWEGDVIWDFFYFDTLYNPHHDIEPLPNGNILAICWEVKTQEEAESMGRVNINGEIWPTKIVELQPPNGIVVWEWHLWDHLIQDADSSLPNYGVVSDHPELLDINKGAPVNNVNGDWLHANAITYNKDLDQIIFSSRHMNEIYVIDHSTTTEEAAGHSGGNSGKGGDFLYRWGNPMNYDRGTINDRRIVAPHGANWVESGFPGGGNIMIYNNNPYDNGNGGNSEAIEIDPPVDSNGDYYISPDSAYGPSDPAWTHGGDTTYFSGWQGGAYRLHNGNTLITVSQQRFIFEVNTNNEIVWQCHVGAHLGWSGNPLRAYKLKPSFFLNEPNIELSTDSINFGGVMDGLTGTQLMHVYNAGDTDLELDTLYCTGNFSVIPSYGTVSMGDTLTLEVTFAPDGDSLFTGIMTIESNDPEEGNLMVNLSGAGTPQTSVLEVSSSSLNFGPINPEQAITRQLTIYNTGMLDLTIEEITISGDPGFSTTFSDATVVPNDSVVVDFQFYTEDNINEAYSTASIVTANSESMDILLQAGLLEPILEDIDDQQISEDDSLSIEVSATSDINASMTFIANSDTSDVFVTMDSTTLIAIPAPDWNGISLITVFVTDENELSDTTDFTLTINAVNDSPELFYLIYPTESDTIDISTDTDELIQFYWNACEDIDNEVSYKLMILLDYYGDVYNSQIEDIPDSSVLFSGYEYAVLMTDLNLPMWKLEYVVEATDGEYIIQSDTGEFVFNNTSLSIDEEVFPETFALHQNYPNPFNPITTFRYDLPEKSIVNITVYDMLGREVSVLVNTNQDAGYKSVIWDATNNHGNPVSAGVYFYQIKAGEFVQTKKMVLLK